MALTTRAGPDVFLAVLGAPYGGDMVDTVLRLVRALVRRGATVEVWTCGYATFLTHEGMTQDKPVNVFDWDRRYQGVAQLVQSVIQESAGALRWSTCGYCAMERGAGGQIPEVSVPPGGSFGLHIARAATSVFVGVA